MIDSKFAAYRANLKAIADKLIAGQTELVEALKGFKAMEPTEEQEVLVEFDIDKLSQTLEKISE